MEFNRAFLKIKLGDPIVIFRPLQNDRVKEWGLTEEDQCPSFREKDRQSGRGLNSFDYYNGWA